MDDVRAPRFAGRLGERWVIRFRLADGSASDVTGWLEEVRPDHVRLRRRDGAVVAVAAGSVIRARRVSVAFGGADPGRTSAEDLEQIAGRSWVAQWEPLGAWMLRAGGGFTARANSCLAVGDPGRPLAEAAQRVMTYATEHGIEPRIQVIDGSSVEQGLRVLGWAETYIRTAVLVARLSAWLGQDAPDGRAQVSEEWSADWEAAYHRSRPNTADPAVVRQILTGSWPRAFAEVREAGRLTSIGRGQVSRGWLGIASVWTDPDVRGRGQATAVMRALGHWAARLGARSAYLQVAAENGSAIQAYERLGFALHHHYLYLAPPT